MSLDDDDRTLFVGNLHANVTDDILYELFLQAGPIERVSIIPKKNNTPAYGFITYKHESSIQYAIELFKGTNLFRKELIIKKRVPKQANEVKVFDFQDQLQNLQLLAQNLNQNPHIVDFSLTPAWGNRSNRNVPYNIDTRIHFPRPQERNHGPNRNQRFKRYHGKKRRKRD